MVEITASIYNCGIQLVKNGKFYLRFGHSCYIRSVKQFRRTDSCQIKFEQFYNELSYSIIEPNTFYPLCFQISKLDNSILSGRNGILVNI